MTRLLVSVRSVDEARLALRAEVDWVDVKEPRRGSLGAADRVIIAEIVALAAGIKPVSAACGELRDWAAGQSEYHAEHTDQSETAGSSATSMRASPLAGLSHAKLGLSHCCDTEWESTWLAWRGTLAAGTEPVAVAYADYRAAHAPEPAALLDFAAEQRVSMLLIDTWDKARGDLLAHLSIDQLASIVGSAHDAAVQVALAGSLSLARLDELIPLAPDIVAVRGDVCWGPREGQLDPERLAAWVSRLAESRRLDSAPALRVV